MHVTGNSWIKSLAGKGNGVYIQANCVCKVVRALPLYMVASLSRGDVLGEAPKLVIHVAAETG